MASRRQPRPPAPARPVPRPVLIYCVDEAGRPNPETLREAEAIEIGKTTGHIWIKFQDYDQYDQARTYSWFFNDPLQENYRRKYGDTGMPCAMYYAETDDEF